MKERALLTPAGYGNKAGYLLMASPRSQPSAFVAAPLCLPQLSAIRFAGTLQVLWQEVPHILTEGGKALQS